ncbi:hypothetical protein AX16_002520 [Volvariella volvacea WC 439]|nr:hypothetical protein AX16_002520 [Volvariella volvacea WC 439]
MSANVNSNATANVNKNGGAKANASGKGQRSKIPLRSALKRGGTSANLGRDEGQASAQAPVEAHAQAQGQEHEEGPSTLPAATATQKRLTTKRSVSFLTPSTQRVLEAAAANRKNATRRASSTAASSAPREGASQGQTEGRSQALRLQPTRKVKELVEKYEKGVKSGGGMAGGRARAPRPAASSTGGAGASSSAVTTATASTTASTSNRGGRKGKGTKNVAGKADKKVGRELSNTQDQTETETQNVGASAGASTSATTTTTTRADTDTDTTPKPLNRRKAPAPSRTKPLDYRSARAPHGIETSDATPPVQAQTPAPAPATTPLSAVAQPPPSSSQVPSSGVGVTPLIKRMQPGTNTPQIIMPGIARATDKPETDGGDTDNGGDTDVEDEQDLQTTPRPRRAQLARRLRSTSTMSIVNASLPMLSSEDPIIDAATSDLDVLAIANDDDEDLQRRPRYGQPVRILIEDEYPQPPSSPTPRRGNSPKISMFRLPPSSPRDLWSSPPLQPQTLPDEDRNYDREGGGLPFSQEQTMSNASHLQTVEERLDAPSSPPRRLLSGSSSDHVLPTPSSPIADQDQPIAAYPIWPGPADVDEEAGAEVVREQLDQPDSEASDPSPEGGDGNVKANSDDETNANVDEDVLDESDPHEGDVTTTPKDTPPRYVQVPDISPEWPLSFSPVIPRTTPPPAPSAQALALSRRLESNPELFVEAVRPASTATRPPATAPIPPVAGKRRAEGRATSPADVVMLSRASSVMDIEEESREDVRAKVQNGGFGSQAQPQPSSSDCTMRDASPAPPAIAPSSFPTSTSAFIGMHGHHRGSVPQTGTNAFGLATGLSNTAKFTFQSLPLPRVQLQPRDGPHSLAHNMIANTANARTGTGTARQDNPIANRDAFAFPLPGPPNPPRPPSPFGPASTNPHHPRFTSHPPSAPAPAPATATAARADPAPSFVHSGHNSYNRHDRAHHDQPRAQSTVMIIPTVPRPQSYLAGSQSGFLPFPPPSTATSLTTTTTTTTTPAVLPPAPEPASPPAATPTSQSEPTVAPQVENNTATGTTSDSHSAATAADTAMMPTAPPVLSPNTRFTQSISRIAARHGAPAPSLAGATTPTTDMASFPSSASSPSNDGPALSGPGLRTPTTPPSSLAAQSAKGDDPAHPGVFGHTRPTSILPTTPKPILVSLPPITLSTDPRSQTQTQGQTQDPLSPPSPQLPPFRFKHASLECMSGEFREEWVENLRREVYGVPKSKGKGKGKSGKSKERVKMPVAGSEADMLRRLAIEQLMEEKEAEEKRRREEKSMQGGREGEREKRASGGRREEKRRASGEAGDGERAAKRRKVSGGQASKRRERTGDKEKGKDREMQVDSEERRGKSTSDESMRDSVESQGSNGSSSQSSNEASLTPLIPSPMEVDADGALPVLLPPMPGQLEPGSPIYRYVPASSSASSSSALARRPPSPTPAPRNDSFSNFILQRRSFPPPPPRFRPPPPPKSGLGSIIGNMGKWL